MHNDQVVKPPTSLASSNSGKTTIFLGGSIEMGKAIDWQTRVEAYFSGDPSYQMFNPRRDDWDSSWKQEYTDPQFYQQVNWELNALEKADHIIIYFDKDTKSPISLLELGLYAASGKMKVCCPDGFYRKGNVEITCEKFGVPMYNDLEDLLLSYDLK